MSADEIRELVERGWSDDRLAEEWGVSREAAARRRLRAGVRREAVPVNRGPVPQEKVDRMGALLDEGMSRRAVAQAVGVHYLTVERHFPGRTWTRAQAAQHAVATRRGFAAVERAWKGRAA